MTVYQDFQELADACAGVVQAFSAGEQPVFGDTESWDNHMIAGPAIICSSKVVDATNYEKLLVQTGVYNQKQLS